MRKLVIYLSVAAFSFCAGLLANKLWPAIDEAPRIDKPLSVSVCELEREPELFDGKLVGVKAEFEGNNVGLRELGAPFIYDRKGCGYNVNMSLPIYLADFDKAHVTVSQRFSVTANPPFAIPEVKEAIIVGIFKADHCAQYNHGVFCNFNIILKSAVLFEDHNL
ncbi:MAG TPA: hypothetical protein VF779_01520 [Pyrinomonadaceae bacterium]